MVIVQNRLMMQRNDRCYQTSCDSLNAIGLFT